MFDRIRSKLKALATPGAATQVERPDIRVSGLRKAEGDALLSGGDATGATRAFRSAIDSDPQNADAFIALGHALWKLSRHQEAVAALESALAIDEHLIDAHYLLALIAQDFEDWPRAIDSFERLLQLAPDVGEAYAPLFKAYVRLGRLAEAKICAEKGKDWCKRVAKADPGSADRLNNCGLLLRDLDWPEEAFAMFERALVARPAFAEAMNNRGLVLHDLNRFDESVAEYDRAIQINERLADVHVHRGHALRELVRHEEALAAYQRAQEIAPREETFLNESLSRLVLGDLPAGWEKYEWRWQATGRTHPRSQFAVPLWLGKESLSGKTIFLYAEQGLGDTIQLCRYAKCVCDLGASVVLGVQRSLIPVLRGLEGIDRIIPLGPHEPMPSVDYHCPLLSLPLAFATSLSTIPRMGPYIHLIDTDHSALREAWRNRLGASGSKQRIGVVWSGNADHTNDRNRSIPLSNFVEVISPGARFIALQNEVRSTDESTLHARLDLEYFGADLIDFGQTAALISEVDLVVSVDTAVAHLAAAMGKQVWLLVPFNPDWRWLLDRSDSPWYETIRLFRQSRRADWSGVLTQVRLEIENFARKAAPHSH